MCAKILSFSLDSTHMHAFTHLPPKKVKELKIQKERHKERYTQMFHFTQKNLNPQWPPHHPKDFHGCCATVMAKIGWKVFFQPLPLQCRPPKSFAGLQKRPSHWVEK